METASSTAARPSVPASGEQEIGTLVKWNADKGFGFISRDNGAPDTFCHVSQLLDRDVGMEQGARVTFKVAVDSRKGKEHATQVRLAAPRGRCRYGSACY